VEWNKKAIPINKKNLNVFLSIIYFKDISKSPMQLIDDLIPLNPKL
jgi:hypothetical protein